MPLTLGFGLLSSLAALEGTAFSPVRRVTGSRGGREEVEGRREGRRREDRGKENLSILVSVA